MIWTRANLERLLADARRGMSLERMVQGQPPGVTTQDADLALWAALGTPADVALKRLNFTATQQRWGSQ